MKAAFEVVEWLEQLRNSYVFGDGSESTLRSPIAGYNTLLILYFPDLEANRVVVQNAYSDYLLLILSIRQRIIPVMGAMKTAELVSNNEDYKTASDERVRIVNEVTDDCVRLRNTLVRGVSEFSIAAAAVMHSIMDIDRQS